MGAPCRHAEACGRRWRRRWKSGGSRGGGPGVGSPQPHAGGPRPRGRRRLPEVEHRGRPRGWPATELDDDLDRPRRRGLPRDGPLARTSGVGQHRQEDAPEAVRSASASGREGGRRLRAARRRAQPVDISSTAWPGPARRWPRGEAEFLWSSRWMKPRRSPTRASQGGLLRIIESRRCWSRWGRRVLQEAAEVSLSEEAGC